MLVVPAASGTAAHAASHADGGSDEVDVTDLAGFPGGATTFLRDDGTFAAPGGGPPDAHAASHQNGGADEISVTGLTGLLATAQTPAAHAHPQSEVTSLVTDLGALDTRIDALEIAPPAHTHTLANITDDGALAALNTVDTAQIDDGAVTAAKTSITGTPSGSKFLRDDWSWQATAGGDDSRIQVVQLTADYTNDTTTGTEVTGLEVALPAAGTYMFRYYLITQSASSTAGLKFGINHTGTTTRVVVHRRYVSTGTTAANGVAASVITALTGNLVEGNAARTLTTTAPNLGPNTGMGTTAQDVLMIIEGVIVVSVAGNLELWCGSDAASTEVRVESGSSVEVVRTV